MKRRFSLLLSVCLIFSWMLLMVPVAIFAGELEGVEVKVTGVKSSEMDAIYVASAYLVNLPKNAVVQGKWDFVIPGVGSFDGSPHFDCKDKKGCTVYLPRDKFTPGKKYQMTVDFTGTINGHNALLRTNYSFIAPKPYEAPPEPVLTVYHKYVNGKHRVSGTIKRATKAKGAWLIGIGPDGSESLKGFKFYKENVEGLSLSHTFEKQLKPGEYVAFVKFYGEVDGRIYDEKDGRNNALFASVSIKVKKEVGTEPKESQNKIGGKLPKTATNYPVVIAGGAVILIAGTGLLVLRRNT